MKNIGKANPYYPGRLQSDTIAVLVLLANAEQHFTAPTASTVAVFSSTGVFYCLTNGQTAAVPAVTSTSFPSPNTVPELSPAVLTITGGTSVISCIAPANCTLTISFYRDHDP